MGPSHSVGLSPKATGIRWQALHKGVPWDSCYREHSCYRREASFHLLKTENTTVGPATKAGCLKQSYVLAGRERSPLHAAKFPTQQPNIPTLAALHLEQSLSPHQPSLGYLLL